MINGLGYKLANVPTVTGLSSVVADSIISGTTNTSQLILNGVDVSTTLSQVPINTNNITLLQDATTDITYSNVGSIDLTTIDNNVTITTGKFLKSATTPLFDEDVSNKKYVDDKIVALINSAPATLDTLNELAVALGNDPNFATTIATSLGGKASLNSTPQTIATQTLMNNVANVYYGNGVNLTGISSSLLSTTTLPSTGTYYLPWTTASTGTAGLTAYSDSNISFDKTSNRLIVPNLRSFGQIELTHATPIITTGATNTDLILRTIVSSTGSLLFKTQDTTRVSIDSNGISQFSNQIQLTSATAGNRQINNTFYNLYDTTAGTYRGRLYSDNSYVYLDLSGGHAFMITIGGPNVFQINSSALTSAVPTSIITTVGNTTPSFIIKDSVSANALNFIPSAGASAYNGLVQAGDNIVFAFGTVDTEKLVLTTHSNTTSGVRISPNAVVIGSGGAAINPSHYVGFSSTGIDINTTLAIKNTISGVVALQIDSTSSTFNKPIKAQGVAININDNVSKNSFITQNVSSSILEFTQTYNGGGYSFASNTFAGASKYTSLIDGLLTTQALTLKDSAGGIGLVQHKYTAPIYTIENSETSGDIKFNTVSSGFLTTTPFTINSANCSFTQPPLCPISATSANHLCNKTYTDGAITSNITSAISSNNSSYVNPTIASSITANNSSYVDTQIATSSSPIGSIVMHSSNTIPSGWLLCDGSQVSQATYANLFAIIGATYNNGTTPSVGNFILPNFRGRYARGVGANASIICETTTIGQTSVGQVGKHSHQSATMNTDTQGTTTTQTVVKSASGAIGLVLTHAVVSNGVITTTATNGTSTTTTDTYNPALLTDETRPNNISINYIIKYAGSNPVIITNPSFTQTTNVLTIANNYATSGIINFNLDDASSILQTPLSLSSTGIVLSKLTNIQNNILLSGATTTIYSGTPTSQLAIQGPSATSTYGVIISTNGGSSGACISVIPTGISTASITMSQPTTMSSSLIANSSLTVNGNLTLNGALNLKVGPVITATLTLALPLSQFYSITSAALTTITLPTASATYAGTSIMFKRRTGVLVITINQTGGASVMIPFNSVVVAVSVSMSATMFHCEMFCDGVNWFQMS